MSDVPEDLRYSSEHEWLRLDGDTATVGITDYAQKQLGDVIFVELPQKGDAFETNAPMAVVESVKTASDIYAPVGGEVIEVNEALAGDPGLINKSPYEEGWLFKLKVGDVGEVEELLTPGKYGEIAED